MSRCVCLEACGEAPFGLVVCDPIQNSQGLQCATIRKSFEL